MRRRDFLRLATGGLAATLVPLSGCERIPEPSPALSEPTTLRTVADDETIRGIGRAYLGGAPGESTRDRLVGALLEDGRGDLVSQEDADALMRFLQAKVRADFQAERTVVADGWVLAVTEAQQAALFLLLR